MPGMGQELSTDMSWL